MASVDIKTLVGSCHCGNVQLTIKVPADSLPLRVKLCHCSSCRYTHGTLSSNQATLPPKVEPQFLPQSTIDSLTSYAPDSFDATRYFCINCGCQIGDKYEDGSWKISSAIFDAKDQDCFKISKQCFANSTLDGGLSTFFPKLEYVEAGSYVDDEPNIHSGEDAKIQKSDSNSLLAKCHCGGVSFTISRPSEEFFSRPDGEKWVSAVDRKKWLACLDLCNDCRVVNGAYVIGWMFVPKDHISPTPPANLLLGSSKSYRSSEEVVRTFCSTCGATVFYWCASRPDIVDIATGILRAPEGARAENWVVWRTGRMASLQDGVDYNPSFAALLRQGLEIWGKAKYGENIDFVLPA